MPASLLIDTDVLIDVGRGVDDARDTLDRAEKEHALAVSSITQMELIVGCRNRLELRALDEFLKPFSVISVDEATARMAVELLREYRLSHGLLMPDALIAATALTRSIPLISKNQRDYRFIPHLELLPYPLPL